MSSNKMNKYPKRRKAKLSFKLGKEVVELPVEISCRSGGICIIRHPRMEDIIFPEKELEMPDKELLKKNFWEQLLTRCNKKTKLFAKIAPWRGSWISTGAGIISGVQYMYEIRKKWARVKLGIDTEDKATNKKIFDRLQKKKSKIENAFGDTLKWDYKKDRRSCYIAFNINGGLSNKKSWGSLQNQMIKKMIKLHRALDTHIQALRKSV